MTKHGDSPRGDVTDCTFDPPAALTAAELAGIKAQLAVHYVTGTRDEMLEDMGSLVSGIEYLQMLAACEAWRKRETAVISIGRISYRVHPDIAREMDRLRKGDAV